MACQLAYADGTNISGNFLRNTLNNKIYMAVFDKKYGSVQERKEIVIESETKKVCVTRFVWLSL